MAREGRKGGRRSKKRQRIIDTAIDLFMKYGFRRITVGEICREAGASKMTFYKYFSNKMELIKEIWNGWLDEGYRKLEEYDAMPIPFHEKLQRIIEYKMELLKGISREFMDDVLGSDPELRGFVEEIRRRNIARFMRYLEKAQERGEMRPMKLEFFMVALDKIQEIADNGELRALYGSDSDFVREINNFLFFGVLPVGNR